MKKIAYIGCLGVVAIISTEFGIIGILPQISQHYNITIDKAGILLSAFALVIALTGPFTTLLTSGINRKKIMLASIALFVVTGLVSAMAPPFWLLLTVRLLPTFLQPVFISTAIGVAIASGTKKQEHQLMGIVISGIAIAMVTTVPLTSYIASIYNWQASFIMQGIVSAVALLFIFKALPTMPVTEKKSHGSQLKILSNPLFLLSTAMNFFMIAAWFSTYSYFADYLGKVKQMEPQTVSYMMLLFGVTGIVSSWLAGKLLGKSIAGTTVLFLLGTVALPFALQFSGSNTVSTITVIALWGFFYAPCFLTASAYMISAAPNAVEFANSLATSSGNFGVTAGTTVSGWLIVHYGIAQAPWGGLCFGILSLSMIGVRHIMERKSKKQSYAACKAV